MCGIIAILLLKNSTFFHILFESLKQIQNRGYDSAGFSFTKDNKINTIKFASDNISALDKLNNVFDKNISSTSIIAHTRWATHGAKTDYNSHPHLSFDNKLSLVHNGIIENYQEIKNFLISKNITFKSDTDTEVISNLIEYYYLQTLDIKKAIIKATLELTGTWGLAIIHLHYPDQIFCIRHGSPLLIGIDDKYIMIASELAGFTNKVKNYFVLENHDLAHLYIKNNKLEINTSTVYNKKQIDNIKFELTPKPYTHWTHKEIMEQPKAILRSINYGGRIQNDHSVKLGGLSSHISKFKTLDNIIILGCGTSLHAGLIGAEYFKELSDFNTVQVFDGAEFEIKDIPKKGNTALIYLSQSGETKDLHRCIQIGKDNNLLQIGIINVVDSLIAREVDCGCYINAGREVGVASTKCFTNQVIILSLIAIWTAQIKDINKNKRIRFINDLRKLSNDATNTLDICETHKTLLTNFINVESLFILGKGLSRFIAREGALKIKEICYLHAEGYGGSALKHGPFALLDKNHPVILLIPYNKYYYKMMNAKEEILARNAPVLIISNKKSQFLNEIILPTNNTYQDLLSIIPLQLASYYCSIYKGINCDQPKNLAKCVNVE